MEATIEKAAPYQGDLSIATNGQAVSVPADPAVPYAMGWNRDLPDLRDYTVEHEKVAAILDDRPAGATIRGSSAAGKVDLRQWCSPIEDQRDIGSCTANASVGIVEYFERRAFGKHLDGSRLFVYKATRNLLGLTGDTGAWLRSAMGALATFGVPPEKYWPYDTKKFDVEPPAFVYALGQAYQAESFYRLDPVGTTPDKVLDAIKKHLFAGIPSMFGFTVYDSISQADGAGKGKIPFPLVRPRRRRARDLRRRVRRRHRDQALPRDGADEGRADHPQLVGHRLGRPRLRLPAVRLRAQAAGGRLVGADQVRVARSGPVQAVADARGPAVGVSPTAVGRRVHDRVVDQPLDRRAVVRVDRRRPSTPARGARTRRARAACRSGGQRRLRLQERVARRRRVGGDQDRVRRASIGSRATYVNALPIVALSTFSSLSEALAGARR